MVRHYLSSGLYLLASMLAPAALAAVGPAAIPLAPQSQTEAALPEAKSSILDKFYVNVFSNFHGPNTSNLASAYAPGASGLPGKQGINFDSNLTIAYLFNKDVGIGPDLPFYVTPVMGKWFSIGDVGVKAFNRETIEISKNLHVYTNLILQAPTSSHSQGRHMVMGVKTTPNIRYSIPATRFTVGAWTEAKAYLGVATDRTFKLWAAPYVSFKILNNLSVSVQFEHEAIHRVGDAGILSFAPYQTDFVSGVSWNITPKIMLMPYWQVFLTNAQISPDRMSLGALISATLL